MTAAIAMASLAYPRTSFNGRTPSNHIENLQTKTKCSNQNHGQVLQVISRRTFLSLSLYTTTLTYGDIVVRGPETANAEEMPGNAAVNNANSKEAESESGASSLFSLFDANEKTKSGKVLPKSYLKSARQVVKSLRESLKQESSKESDVRRSADSAKEAIRDYIQNWRGQQKVSSEDSYKALESVFRILGNFYRNKGPRAVLPSDIKSQIMENLDIAESAL